MPTESTTAPRSGSVQSVERVFELLEAIFDAGGEISLSDLAAASELPMPTIHRLLRTCVSLGYARQLPNRRYALGARLIPLGERAGRQLGQVAQPRLQDLVADLGETANLAILEGSSAVYVAQQPSRHSMRMFPEIGRRVNLHATGVGKAILSLLDDEQVQALVERAGLPTPTPNSHRTLQSLMDDLTQIRGRGYAVDNEEQEIGVRCYAVPVPGAPSQMAVSVSGPLSRVDDAFGAQAVPKLLAAAASIGEDLLH